MYTGTEETQIYKHQEVHPRSSFFQVQSQGHLIPIFFDLVSADLKKITLKGTVILKGPTLTEIEPTKKHVP